VNYEKAHLDRDSLKPVSAKVRAVHANYQEADIDPSLLLSFMDHIPTDLLIFSYSVNRHMFVLCDSLRKYRWEVRKELVWVKNTFAFWAGAAYQQQHEPIWICTRDGAGFRNNVPNNASTVLTYDKPHAHDLHPTAKPIELWKRLVMNHSCQGDLIVEPFSGSGTSIMAAEELSRRCYAMELSPAYCDVAVKRWEQFTGKQATRDGQTST
jgi:DNA modification methylase